MKKLLFSALAITVGLSISNTIFAKLDQNDKVRAIINELTDKTTRQNCFVRKSALQFSSGRLTGCELNEFVSGFFSSWISFFGNGLALG